jgi:ABC-type uncharacterized transport system auxiliary subunit
MRYTVFVLAFAAAGCFTTKYTPVVHLSIEPQPNVNPASTVDKSLGVRPLQPALPYKQDVVYRGSEHVIAYQQGVMWAELPRDTVTRALVDALTETKRFADVGDAADLRVPDLILTGQLRKFDEVRIADPWMAECEVRLELRAGIERRAVWAATLCAREPLAGNGPAALAAAMSRAVTRIVEQAAAAIVALDETALGGETRP